MRSKINVKIEEKIPYSSIKNAKIYEYGKLRLVGARLTFFGYDQDKRGERNEKLYENELLWLPASLFPPFHSILRWRIIDWYSIGIYIYCASIRFDLIRFDSIPMRTARQIYPKSKVTNEEEVAQVRAFRLAEEFRIYSV